MLEHSSINKRELIRTQNIKNGTVYEAWDYKHMMDTGHKKSALTIFFPGKFSV